MPAGLLRLPNFTDKVAERVTAHTVDLMRVSESLRRDIITDLEALEQELAFDLMRAAGKSDLSLARMSALFAQTRQTIDTAYGKIADASEPSLRSIAAAIGRKTLDAVNALAKVELMSVGLTKEQVISIAGRTVIHGKFPWQWWKSQAPSLRTRFANQIRLGQYRGETVDQLIRRIRGTKANGYTDGLMQVPKYQAEALVRTSVIAVSNEAKLASYLNNRDVIRAIQWVATLDDRTTEICRDLNGKVWILPASGDKDSDYIPEGHSTPFPGATAHWNCRSVQVPVTFSFAELAKREAAK